MAAFYVWLGMYVLPALIAGTIVRLRGPELVFLGRYSFALHGLIAISALGSQIAIWQLGLTFPWTISIGSVCAYVCCALLSAMMLGPFGIWYAVSSLVQQFAMMSVAFLLSPTLGVWSVLLLVVPSFVLCHDVSGKLWYAKLMLLSLWGTSCIPLFLTFHDVIAISAGHTVLGSFLIARSLVYPELRGSLASARS
jgi:hypothetical protein